MTQPDVSGLLDLLAEAVLREIEMEIVGMAAVDRAGSQRRPGEMHEQHEFTPDRPSGK